MTIGNSTHLIIAEVHQTQTHTGATLYKLPARSDRPRVLVVNADPDQAYAVARMLEFAGYMPTVAHDIESASLAISSNPDQILWDIESPSIERREASMRLRALLLEAPAVRGT